MISISATDGGLSLKGLSAMDPEQGARIVGYAKANKPAILAALATGHPSGCPLMTSIVPDGCRFDPKLFNRLRTEGALSIDGGCPVLKVCKLK